MRPRILLLLPLLFLLGCQSPEEKAVRGQLLDYPQSRAQDIYKNFCQDCLGPEHLIPDPAYARNYLQTELRTYGEDLDSARYEKPALRYYPVGDKGNYIRVDLSVVLDGLVSEEQLLDAFVRSANEGARMPEEAWVAKWGDIETLLRRKFPDIPELEKDLSLLDSYVENGDLIMHHSQAFSEAYHPHYRIIARGIFEKELSASLGAGVADR
ncbi:MAG: hypothetical protein J6W82_07100 [Bacteroidales bacterium]|nr:hypothetical protein [Bacteroidales bacterium]